MGRNPVTLEVAILMQKVPNLHKNYKLLQKFISIMVTWNYKGILLEPTLWLWMVPPLVHRAVELRP